jgi:hypothetical protein
VTTTIAPLTHSAYIAKANAICTRLNAQSNAIKDPGPDPIAVANTLDRATTITSSVLKQLRALPMPAADVATLRALYAKVDRIVADAHRTAAASFGAGDTASGKRLVAVIDADSKAANDASNAYGLTVCGQS